MRRNIMHILVSPSKNRSKSVDAGHSTDKEKIDVINKTSDNNEKNSDNDYLVCTRKNLKSNHDVNMEKQIVKTGDNSTSQLDFKSLSSSSSSSSPNIGKKQIQRNSIRDLLILLFKFSKKTSPSFINT